MLSAGDHEPACFLDEETFQVTMVTAMVQRSWRSIIKPVIGRESIVLLILGKDSIISPVIGT